MARSEKNTMSGTGKKIDLLGLMMVLTPLLSSILLWYGFYHIDKFSNIITYFYTVIVFTVLLSTILATIDSHRLGLRIKIYGRKEIYGGSFLKFFVFLILWIYAYPVYLYRRKNFGGRNLLYPFLFSIAVLVASSIYLHYTVNIKNIEKEAYQRRLLRHSR
ncbi:MAG: hypothetical protein R6V47_04915 [Candidatus Delongbacteria bacterium]